ncbi:MAG TPA: hypothetical protein VG889_22075 [Rhizomicrobium sp.]|nr:hypothetical protein [Rhizomicrobium sp.]
MRGTVALLWLMLASAAAAQPVGSDLHASPAWMKTDRAGHPAGDANAPVDGFTPSDLRDAYKIATDGSSDTVIAVIQPFGYRKAEADLGVYRATFGLPECTTANGCFKTFNQHGRQQDYRKQDVSWGIVSALMLDMASAMCPNCRLWLVEARDNYANHLARAVDTAAALGAHVIAIDYVGVANEQSYALDRHYTHSGVAVVAPLVDNINGTLPYPAASPHVTAVGGTFLTRDGSARGWSETGGMNTGGCTDFEKPEWQTDSGCAKRTIGDVAAMATPGAAIYAPRNKRRSRWYVYGGTAASAGIIAGIYGANGGTVTYGKTIYDHPEALFDVTSGIDVHCNPVSYLCQSGPGYDGPTGLGTPNGIAAFGDP